MSEERTLDEDDRELLRSVGRYLNHVHQLAQQEQTQHRTPLGDRLSEHLGADAATLPAVTESFADHRLIDADIALELLAEPGRGTVIGVTGGQQRYHLGFTELIANAHFRTWPGPVDYVERATGPRSSRRTVAFGIRLLHHAGRPLAVLQRAAVEHSPRPAASLEVLGTDPDAVSAFLERLRHLMIEHSVLRGQVLSFRPTQFGQEAGATFVERPRVAAEDIILADGVLASVVHQVIGIGEHRETLRAAGQHLKRGVLLYGPPGTGKTLTVRHIVSRAVGTTVVLLSGSGIRFVNAAAELARTFQPSIVVLEDVDLVAMERHNSPQPLLFEVLEALDGLDGDADVTFVLTTNRVEVLEPALAERPGRVDLAVEVPLPALAERERLLRLYAGPIPFSEAALRQAAERTEGTTGSFAKELVRRAVLHAALAGRSPGDDELAASLDELLGAREQLTRRVLGGPATRPGSPKPREQAQAAQIQGEH